MKMDREHTPRSFAAEGFHVFFIPLSPLCGLQWIGGFWSLIITDYAPLSNPFGSGAG
jgi:hypothetical protein